MSAVQPQAYHYYQLMVPHERLIVPVTRCIDDS